MTHQKPQSRRTLSWTCKAYSTPLETPHAHLPYRPLLSSLYQRADCGKTARNRMVAAEARGVVVEQVAVVTVSAGREEVKREEGAAVEG